MKMTLSRTVAGLLVLIVSGTTGPLWAQQPSTAQSQSAPAQTQSQPVDQNQNQLPPPELPENPGRSTTLPNAPQQNPAPQNAPPSQPAQGSQPSGTAVAPPVQISGGAASKPAGVAIAPPKQRQVRSLLLKFGLIAAAGAAVGTVVGLSEASPSRVPNSGH